MAVLTDYAAMEAHKGDTLISIFRSMEVLCDFPDQVLVLKSTRVACGLRGRSAGLQRRLIDERQSREFPAYVRSLLSAKKGDPRFLRAILDHGRNATAHIDQILQDAETIGQAIEAISQLHTKEERAAYRNNGEFPPGMVDKVVKNVMHVAGSLFANHPNINRWPSYAELPNTFIFRYSLCMYLLALDWAAMGGVENASSEKLRNDAIDMNFAAYGTYFDGLLTSDSKAARIHQEAGIWLSALFDCRIPGTPSR